MWPYGLYSLHSVICWVSNVGCELEMNANNHRSFETKNNHSCKSSSLIGEREGFNIFSTKYLIFIFFVWGNGINLNWLNLFYKVLIEKCGVLYEKKLSAHAWSQFNQRHENKPTVTIRLTAMSFFCSYKYQ